jgi:hypothetical protein
MLGLSWGLRLSMLGSLCEFYCALIWHRSFEQAALLHKTSPSSKAYAGEPGVNEPEPFFVCAKEIYARRFYTDLGGVLRLVERMVRDGDLGVKWR